MDFREHVPLAPMTTFKIGGAARWFAEATTAQQVLESVHFARERQLPLFVLGGGSNLLISDQGYGGLVLRIGSLGVHAVDRQPGFRTFAVGAGESWDRFVDLAVQQNCGGIECLAGIPGTVGGTPIQNVGAYGQEASETIVKVGALDLSDLTFGEMNTAACKFDYRRSVFNREGAGRYIVLEVHFRLRENAAACLEYRDLQEYFRDFEGKPSLTQVASAVREIRKRKGMVLVEGDPDTRSAGSFFKNPLVTVEQMQYVAEAANLDPAAVPHFAAGNCRAKIPAAWLLEHAGIVKGYRKGNAAVSSRHTLALTNHGGASAREILELRDEIQARVKDRFGIALEMEPILVGFQ